MRARHQWCCVAINRHGRVLWADGPYATRADATVMRRENEAEEVMGGETVDPIRFRVIPMYRTALPREVYAFIEAWK